MNRARLPGSPAAGLPFGTSARVIVPEWQQSMKQVRFTPFFRLAVTALMSSSMRSRPSAKSAGQNASSRASALLAVEVVDLGAVPRELEHDHIACLRALDERTERRKDRASRRVLIVQARRLEAQTA